MSPSDASVHVCELCMVCLYNPIPPALKSRDQDKGRSHRNYMRLHFSLSIVMLLIEYFVKYSTFTCRRVKP